MYTYQFHPIFLSLANNIFITAANEPKPRVLVEFGQLLHPS